MKTITKVNIAKLIFHTLSIMGFNKKRLVKRNSINWELDLSEGIDLSIFLFGHFQNEITKSIFSMIRNVRKYDKKLISIIDVGSNIGDKSLSLTKKLIDYKINNFKIFSIEPTEFAYQKQLKNLKLNSSLKKKIDLYKLFISDKKKRKKSTYSSWKLNDDNFSHKIHKGHLKQIKKTTKIVTLDNFIKKNKIEDTIILKIDVDGFEMSVLKSCVQSLKKKKVIIFIEFAPYALNENGSNEKEFYGFVKKYNLNILNLNFEELNTIQINEGSSKDIILMQKN